MIHHLHILKELNFIATISVKDVEPPSDSAWNFFGFLADLLEDHLQELDIILYRLNLRFVQFLVQLARTA